MLKISPIKQIVLMEGVLVGTPCIVIQIDNKNGVDTEVNEILTEVLKSKLKTVVVSGKLIENTEIKVIIEGLVSKGKLVYFVTDASDIIETIRRLRNVIFCLKLQPPSSTENEVDSRNLPMLQELDEIMITLTSVEDYEKAKSYLSDRLISRPTVFFRVSNKMDVKELTNLIPLYIADAENFNFKNRLININRNAEIT